ncbi:MAG: hypothetical protein PHF63_06360 [Herbinix sp.]|nr:hypothetical protein [Herbinix sp.]
MKNAVGFLGSSLLANLTNNLNFYILYITMVVVFFLLGLILGISIETRKKSTNDNMAPTLVDNKKKPNHTDPLVQESKDLEDIQNNRINSGSTHSRHRHNKHHSQ